MHDLSRRVDQLRHLQWGHVADRLGAKEADVTHQRAELSRLRTLVEQEKAQREAGQRELEKVAEACQSLVHQERSSQDAAMQRLGEKFSELQVGTLRGFQERDTESAKQQRSVADVARALEAEKYQREQGDGSARGEHEELRKALEAEVVGREEACQRLFDQVAEGNNAGQAAWREECQALRQQMAELRQALAAERRERMAADATAVDSVGEIRRLLAQEGLDRSEDTQALVASMQELESMVAASQQESKQLNADHNKKLSSVVEGHQQERGLHLQTVGEHSRTLEALKRSAEKNGEMRDMVTNSLARIAEEVTNRCAEETGHRENEFARVMRLVSEEHQEIERSLSAKVLAAEQASAAASAARSRELREVQRQMGDHERSVQAATAKLSGYMAEEEKERELVHMNVGAALEDHRAALEQGFASISGRVDELSHGHTTYKEARAATERELHASLRAFSEEHSTRGSAMRAELREVGEVLAKLRADCKEALVREVRQRMEHDASLQEALEQEGNARVEAVKMLDQAIDELRLNLLEGFHASAVQHLSPASPSNSASPSLTATATTTAAGPSPTTFFRDTMRNGHHFAAGAVAAAAAAAHAGEISEREGLGLASSEARPQERSSPANAKVLGSPGSASGSQGRPRPQRNAVI